MVTNSRFCVSTVQFSSFWAAFMESQIRRNAWRNHTRTWGLGEISKKKKTQKLPRSRPKQWKNGLKFCWGFKSDNNSKTLRCQWHIAFLQVTNLVVIHDKNLHVSVPTCEVEKVLNFQTNTQMDLNLPCFQEILSSWHYYTLNFLGQRFIYKTLAFSKRGRSISPFPTGHLHLGTALYNARGKTASLGCFELHPSPTRKPKSRWVLLSWKNLTQICRWYWNPSVFALGKVLMCFPNFLCRPPHWVRSTCAPLNSAKSCRRWVFHCVGGFCPSTMTPSLAGFSYSNFGELCDLPFILVYLGFKRFIAFESHPYAA